ncbi:unnamed protein product [Pedinophyceae sp. YPF-701]|nr:unnamed protein product [Pedinophyceae sp. YPF-701]
MNAVRHAVPALSAAPRLHRRNAPAPAPAHRALRPLGPKGLRTETAPRRVGRSYRPSSSTPGPVGSADDVAATAQLPAAPKEKFELINGISDMKSVQDEVFAGLTTAVVALPLALAFGVASGAGALAGLYGAIFVGFFAALLGGTPSQVSGPTGPMTVIMASIIAANSGSTATAFTVVALAGVLQVVFGALRLGGLIFLVPKSVTSGFMTGIGSIIISLQSAVILGSAAKGNVPAALASLPTAIKNVNPSAAALGALSLACCLYWPAKLRKFVPGPLAALIITTTLSATGVLAGAPTLGALPSGLPSVSMPVFSLAVLAPAVTLAILGTIDSLLTSLVADSITGTYHKPNRELIGQGVGNFVAGLFGGVAGAGATMRTVVNVRAGGRTPISGAMHSVFLLGIVLCFSQQAGAIPHAALAGILIKTGLDVIDWTFLKRWQRLTFEAVAAFATTVLLTVFVDLIQAVVAGTALTMLLGIASSQKRQVNSVRVLTGKSVSMADIDNGRCPLRVAERLGAEKGLAVYSLRGDLDYAGATPIVRSILPDLESRKGAVLDLSKVESIDSSVALAVEELVSRAHKSNVALGIAGAAGQPKEVLSKLGVTSFEGAGIDMRLEECVDRVFQGCRA